MPDATLDLDEIVRAAGDLGESIDLDAILRALPADDIIARERRKAGLRQERNLALLEGSRAGALGEVIGGVEPAVEAAAYFPWDVINFPSVATGGHPLIERGAPVVHVPATTESIRQAIVQNPVLAGSILGGNPDLSAGVARGGLDVAESFTTPPNLMLLGALPKAAPNVHRPVTATFATTMGLDVPHAAALLGEATVTEPYAEQVRQATVLGVNIALPTQMAAHPEIRGRRAADTEAIRLEKTRLEDLFRQQREQERESAQAAESERLLGSDPFRRSAAAFATQQGIPVEVKPAEPVKPVVPAPPVEEIEPFGTVRQFRVTREFYNPADEGVYKVGDIIPEPQLTKAGVAVPEPKAPPPTQPTEPSLTVLAPVEPGAHVELPNIKANPIGAVQGIPVYEGRGAMSELRRQYGLPNAIARERIDRFGNPFMNPFGNTDVFFTDDSTGKIVAYHRASQLGKEQPPAAEVRPTEGGPSAIPIQSAAKIPVQPTPGGRPAVVQGIPKPEEPPGTRPVVAPEVKAETADTEVGQRISPRLVAASRQGNSIRLEVDASGPPVTPEQIERMFEGPNRSVSVIAFAPNEFSTALGRANFEVIIGTPEGPYSPELAKSTFREVFGTDNPITGRSAVEGTASFEERFTRSIRAAQAREAGIATPKAEAAAPEVVPPVAPVPENRYGVRPVWLKELAKPENADILELWKRYQEGNADAGWFFNQGGRDMLLRLEDVRELMREYPSQLTKASATTPASVKPAGERITIANNKTVELPEFTLEMIRRGSEEAHTGLTRPASIQFSTRQKAFLLIKGAGQRASYRIPLSEIPHEITKGGISFDKQAVLAFLNDKAKRQAAMAEMIEDRYVTHFAPEDIDLIQKPTGRPATGAGAPLREVTMEPKKLEAIAPAAPGRSSPEPETIAALDALEKANPRMAEALEMRRIEELGSVFWAGVREEFLNMADRPEYREPLTGAGLELYRRQTDPSEQIANPTKADSLIASIRLLKERGDITRAQFSISPKGWKGITGEPARAAQEAVNLREARTLVDDPNNGLSDEARAVLRDILDSPVAAYLNGRQIRFRIVDASDATRGVTGWYEPATEILNIVRRSSDPLTGAHEFFHPLWEMVQDADRNNVRMWRDAAIDEARRSATGKDIADLEKLSDEFDTVFGADVGYRGYRDMRYETFLAEGIAEKFYHLSSAEEFFAWMLTERFAKDRLGIWGQAKEIFASQDAFLSKVRQILQVIFDSIRQRVPGLRTQADILQRTILEGKYEVLPPSENIPGKKLVTKNAVITAPGVGPAAAITAHHGTPHQVDRFTTERVGTGEGAQVYGYGLYFAEHPEVAKNYADRVVGGVFLIDGKRSSPADHFQREAWDYVWRMGGGDVDSGKANYLYNHKYDANEGILREIEALRGKTIERPEGNAYTVRLDVEPGDLLDWDKPMSQQSPKVQQALAAWVAKDTETPREYISEMDGRQIYDSIVDSYTPSGATEWSISAKKSASEYLLSLGIPGIRYLDQGSRAGKSQAEWDADRRGWIVRRFDGEKVNKVFSNPGDAWLEAERIDAAAEGRTYNFVIFDESKIHITHENGQEVSLREAMGKERGVQAALESRENVEKYVEPLEQMRSPEFYRGMAWVINRGLVPEPRAERYFALPMQVALELRDVFPYRIETQRPTGPTLREVMADESKTPEERNEYARNALAELQLYQHNRQEVKASQAKVTADLDEATLKAIEAIPPTNEANVEAVNRLGQIIDRIQNERVKTAEGAQVNAVIGEGIEHIDALNQLLRDAPAHSRALSGIARLVGRAALTAEMPGENVLQLISARSDFPGLSAATGLTPRQWVSQLATHLDQMRTPEDNRVINAGRDVIEGTLWGLRQLGDFRQHLMEVQMAEDGTLRRFNAEYLADLRSKTPRGFNAILNKYAKAKVESDALNSASRRLNRKIDALTTRQENLRQAVEFLNEHDADPGFQEFGKAAAEFTGGTSAVEYTDLGPVRTYNDPMTGKPVDVEHTFDKGETLENLQKIKGLIESGLEYAAQPNADPVKAKFWLERANEWEDYLMGINSDARLQDPHWIFNPMRVLTKSRIGLIVETTLSRLPGALAEQGSRAIEAFAGAKKAKDEWLKAQSDLLLGANLSARSKHPGMSLDRWQKEIASPIIDSRQHFGQEEYRTGQRIVGFGHLITPEDMKAVRSQYAFEQHFRKLHEKVKFPAITEAPVKIKEGNLQRFALSRGPGTVTHSIPKSTRDLPAQWAEALKVPPEQGGVDMFLSNKDNFIRIALKHVLEDDRDYFLLGKGKFALDYRSMRAEKQSLQASGGMPANLDGLSEWIARKHNESLAQNEAPATPGEVRKTLVDEISSFMNEIEKNTAERQAAANAANMEIIVNENGFTQPRRGKIAPGSLYEYGLPDKGAMQTKGNEAIEFYAFRYRDAMQAIHDALLKEKDKLEQELGDIYGSTGIIAKHKLDRAIRAGNDPFLQKKQLTLEEVNRNLTRTGHFLNNINDIVKNRRGTYVDDVANHALNPWFGFAVGSALSRPLTWMRNMSSGPVLWGLKTAEIRRGGWMRMPDRVLAQHIGSFIQTMRLTMVPKTDLQRAIKQYLAGHPEEVRHTANFTVALLREAVDRQMMRDIGVIDSFSIRDNIGWDSERPLWQNIKIALDTMRNVSAHTESSDANSIFSTLGIIPRAGQLLTRKIGMRWADNWINSKGTQFTNGLANELRKRAIVSFDGRLANDPVFRDLYEQYGDNYQRFSTALIGRVTGGAQGGLLTPAELTGKWGLGGMDKSAIQLRRTFRRNNDAVDLIMLKYWWNKRHANGDRNAPFFTDGERMALIFALAEDVNMGTMATRAQWWAGSKEKQWFGVLGQYWLWATDRMADMMAKPHGQRTAMVRYMPGVIGFLLASGIAAVVSTQLGQKVNDELLKTVSQKPSFFDATDDAARARAAITTAASLWGAFGSIIAYVTDTPGKLGYKNPFFFANVANDLMGVLSKWYQTGDATGPVLDILARYQPAAQAIINRLPSREGLVEVRNAANTLRAATPETLEAKRRQPSSGNDMRATPMTPLYNTILNAAAVGDWATADETWAKAVEQSRASGNPNPEAAILSAIRTRAPESAVFSRVLTDGERDVVYGRLTPEGRERVDRVNSAFDAISSRYGTGGGGATARAFGGGSRFGALPSGSSALADIGGFSGSRRLSLGSPRGVRSGFRSRSLRRGLRTRRLLRGGLRRPRRSRLRRLAV